MSHKSAISWTQVTRPPDVGLAVLVCVGEDCAGARSEWVKIEWLWDADTWAFEWAEPIPDGWEDIVDGEDYGIYLETGEVDGYCPTCAKAIRGVDLPPERGEG